jgi:hypothetical protein
MATLQTHRNIAIAIELFIVREFQMRKKTYIESHRCAINSAEAEAMEIAA